MKKHKNNTVQFYKMVASGNDFIVIDNRSGVIKNAKQFADRVCQLHFGVGADGVLLLEKSKKKAFKMRILNADGSEAEACGNGFRCISLFAYEKLGFSDRFEFEALAGTISAEVRPPRIKVGMVQPKDYRQRETLEVAGNRLHYSFLNTGVPHAVVLTEGLSKVDVPALGRLIREHRAFRPRGTNVNFVEIRNSHEIEVRTYERGVENETLACGTGSTASALVTALAGYTSSPVRVRTRGGEILNIGFQIQKGKVSEVTLEGEASFVFEGALKL